MSTHLPLTLQFLVVGYLCVALKKIKRGILRVETGDTGDEKLIKKMQALRDEYRNVISASRTTNDIFAPMVLVYGIRDMLTIGALIGEWLKLSPGEGSVFGLSYKTVDEASVAYVYIVGGLGIVNMFMRMGVFIACHDEALKIRRNLAEGAQRAASAPVRRLARQWLLETDELDGAVSAWGLFHITKTYLVTFMGLLSTYAVLIYQTRDSGRTIQKLATKQDLLSHGRELKAHIATLLWNISAQAL